jgi:predicted metalloprotease with PDZ domain
VDYTREQYTRSLWFSEGVTSTVEDYILLRAGIIGEPEYLHRLSAEINLLQQRPAHRTQSAEDSSLETWLDKYPFYRRPERSISYYNKGEILGAMLDLAMRDATNGRKTLRDLFHWMNDHYAKPGRYFADSQGIREAVEAVTGKDFSGFFRDYVAGVEEIPYDHFLNTAGLQLSRQEVVLADAGISVSRNFDGFPAVTTVDVDSEAARAGLQVGDTVVEINSKRNANLEDEIMSMSPGDSLRMRIRPVGQKEREIKLKLGSKKEARLFIAEVDHPTAAQTARRAEWLAGPAQVSGHAPSTVIPLSQREASSTGAARP